MEKIMSLETIREKEQKIQELKQALAELEAKLEAEVKASQHQIINEELDNYFNAVETKYSSLKAFWESLKAEMRKSHTDSEN